MSKGIEVVAAAVQKYIDDYVKGIGEHCIFDKSLLNERATYQRSYDLCMGLLQVQMWEELVQKEQERKMNPHTARLREKAPMFPLIYPEYTQENIEHTFYWLSTMVQFEHEGKLYKRHLMEGGYLSEHYTEEDILARLLKSVENTLLNAVPYSNDELVK